MKKAKLIIILLVFMSCSKEDGPIALKEGQSQRFELLTIEIIDIQDSRCPKDVACIWEGDQRVELKLTQNSDEHQLMMGQSAEIGIPNDTILLDYQITFLEITPYPQEYGGSEINQKAHFTIQKL